jgi:4-hydroxybenzoate polyprenyltransferase
VTGRTGGHRASARGHGILVETPMSALTRHPYLLHLRLGFNLLLSPVYLWGALLAGGGLGDPRFWLGYVSLHLFLYCGTTAFNSYYDRDAGPVGGMLRPPPVDPGLLPFSLIVQALGVPLAALVGGPFLLVWLVLFAVFTAYSHPFARLKANPISALAAIALGQGGLGFALGWLAVAPPAGLTEASGLAGMASTALVLTGLYLVSQCYQRLEDAGRGDRTLAVVWGAGRSLRIALLPLGAGGLLLAWWVGVRIGWGWAALLTGFFALLALWLLLWAARFDEARVQRNFLVAMRFTASASTGLSLFLAAHLILG